MPRRSGGGGGRMGGARPARSPVRSPPQPASHAPPPAPLQSSGGGSMLSGIGSTIAQGLAFGTGSAVAHRAVDGIMGPRTVQHEFEPGEAPAAAGAPAVTNMSGPDSCGNQAKAFQDCLNNYGSDISKCQFYVDMLNECRKGPVSAQF
ncbi:uncharacterized protein LOC131028015 isoform X2 [Cryptomeria japonica]|uniref:uncharacterized protein LOC131028015 isoform X2 n=1 Tax=Cryptomeria japonica TaxID=3369 RepID=UPI0025AD299C|nr:uncharacterized protein LOC131028015 isoform X2 [Cryptomeria japonica]